MGMGLRSDGSNQSNLSQPNRAFRKNSVRKDSIRRESLRRGNHGFDTHGGFYQVIKGDHLAYRYETMVELGRGTFGQVVKCKDHKTGRIVAIKITKNQNLSGSESFMREVKLLERVNQVQGPHNQRVIKLERHFKFRQHLCLVFEMLGCDLYQDLKETKLTGITSMDRIQNISCQLVEGVAHLKESGVIHCDLKPENILFTSDERKDIKLIDLGSACSRDQKGFTYVCSRYYRAPEIVLSGPRYGPPVDMWSVGCIVAELYNGQPLFPAVSQNDLMHYITVMVGDIPEEMIAKSKHRRVYFRANSEDGAFNVIADPKSFSPGINRGNSSIVKEIFMLKK